MIDMNILICEFYCFDEEEGKSYLKINIINYFGIKKYKVEYQKKHRDYINHGRQELEQDKLELEHDKEQDVQPQHTEGLLHK